jgi:hypothetical protein
MEIVRYPGSGADGVCDVSKWTVFFLHISRSSLEYNRDLWSACGMPLRYSDLIILYMVASHDLPVTSGQRDIDLEWTDYML